MSEAKKWYTSKTLVANILSIVVLLVQTETGFVIDAESQVAIMGVLNLILRMATNQSLEA